MEQDNPRKRLYKTIVGGSDQELANGVKKYSFKKFDELLSTNPEFQKDLFLDLQDRGMATDETEFANMYLQVPTKAQPAPQPSQPPAVSLAPPQRQSIEQQAAGQATGFVPPMAVQPEQPVFQPFVQFKNEAELQQTAKSPVFKDYSAASAVIADREKQYEDSDVKYSEGEDRMGPTGKFNIIQKFEGDNQGGTIAQFDTEGQMLANTDRRSAAPSGLIMPFKDAETDFAKMSPEQQAQAIAGSTESKPNQDPIRQTGKLPVVPVGLIGLGTKAVNYGIDIWNSMKRGWTQGEAINQVKQGDLADAANGNPEALKKIDWNALAKTNREISEFGQTEGDKSMERAFSGDSVGINDFVDFFTALPGVTVESLANLARSGWDEATAGAVEGAALGSAVPGIGTVAGAGVGVTAGMIAAGRSMEYYMSLLEELKNKGVDVNNPEALKKGMAAYGKEASEVATTRANAITAVETLLPVLGKVLRLGGGKIAARAAGKLGKAGKVAEKVGGVLENEAIAGPLGGSAGELAAQVGSGQEINLKEIAAEAGGEGAATAAAVARAIKGRTTAPTPPTQLGGIPTIPAPPNAPEFVPPVPPPSGAAQTTYETVTPEELQAFQTDPNFATNNPERAAAIADDVALIQSGQMDINSIEDPNYRLMVESAMGAGQQEQQQGGAAELSQINDRILTIKAAAQEGRIEGDPAEYAALKKRKAELESQVKTEVEVETDPAVADIERRREEELAKFREDNPIQLRPIEVLDQNGNVIQSSSGEFAINKKYDAEIAALQSKGTTTQQAAEEVSRNQELDNVVRNIPIEDVRRPNGAIGTQGFTSTQLKDLIKFINTNLNLGISEDLFNEEKLKPLIDYIKNSPDLVQKIQDYVKKDPIEISIMPDDTIIINDGNHRANLLNLIGSDVLPTIEAAQRNQVDEINAKYDALQSNATPQSETIVADQAAQNMGTAVNQPLETGAAAVEVGESGRPVVEVEGDQVVEEEVGEEVNTDIADLRKAKTKNEVEVAILKATQSDNLKDGLDAAENLIGKAMYKAVFYSDPIKFGNELADAIEKITKKKEKSTSAQEVKTEKSTPKQPETNAQQITDLRAKEQAEYDAMSDPNDEAKREEIYDRYDKLISPLLGEKAPKAEAGSVGVVGDVEATAKALDRVEKENPIKIEETEFGGKLTGGIIDVKIKAIQGDRRADVKTPSTLNFLPKVLELVHLARNKKDKGKIISNGFNAKNVSIDSPIAGIYFSSEDWSTMDRFGRSKEDAIYTTIENDGLLYFDSAKGLRDFLKENNLPSEGQTLNAAQMATLKNMGVKGILLREDFASQSRNELIVIDESIIKGISEKPISGITKLPSSFSNTKDISEAYHKAKADGTNPELVKAVEQSLKEAPKPKAEAPKAEAPKAEAPKPKANKTSPLTPFQTKDKEGVKAEPKLKIDENTIENVLKSQKEKTGEDVVYLPNEIIIEAIKNAKVGDEIILDIPVDKYLYGNDSEEFPSIKHDSGFEPKSKREIKEPIRISIESIENPFIEAVDGNHRIVQARFNKDKTIPAKLKITKDLKDQADGFSYQKSIEAAYNKAKKDGSNPELVKAVETSRDNKPSKLTPFQTKDKEGQAARAALKESVGPKEYKRLENIAKNGEKILKDLQSRQILKIDCP